MPGFSLLRRSELLTLYYTPHQRLSRSANLYRHVALNNPIRFKIDHLWNNRDKNTLWWFTSVKPLMGHKSVVRSWCKRRVRVAFIHALKARGYDREGRVIGRVEEASHTAAAVPSAPLTGTAEIAILPACIKTDFATLRRDVDIMVDCILAKQRRRGAR